MHYLTPSRDCGILLGMKTVVPITERFPTEDACRAYLVELRWKDGVRCPRCGSGRVHKLALAWNWQCKRCSKQGYRFSPLIGTIFENTHVSLRAWFQVIHLMCQSRKGVSALQVQRMIGSGSYRTAWSMCRRIRAAMQDTEFVRLTGADREAGRRQEGVTAEVREDLRRLRREVEALRQEREILKNSMVPRWPRI